MSTNLLPQSVAELRRAGVRGKVNQSDYWRLVVYQAPGVFVEIRVGRIDEGAFDYGYLIIIDENAVVSRGQGMRKQKFPGEGEGWFATEDDAKLYVLCSLRTVFPHDEDIRGVIDGYVRELTQPCLF